MFVGGITIREPLIPIPSSQHFPFHSLSNSVSPFDFSLSRKVTSRLLATNAIRPRSAFDAEAYPGPLQRIARCTRIVVKPQDR
jgi:hypothetical protein